MKIVRGLFVMLMVSMIAFVSFSSYGATIEKESPPDVETVYDVSVDADVLNVDYEYVSNDMTVVEINTEAEKLYLKHSDKGGVYRYNYSYQFLNDINSPPSYGTNYFSYNQTQTTYTFNFKDTRTIKGFASKIWLKSYSMASIRFCDIIS